MLERMDLSVQIHYCTCTLQSILHTVQRLIYSRGAVVIVRQLAQLVRNSVHGVQPNCGVPPHPRGHAELAGDPASRKGKQKRPHRKPSDAHHGRRAGCAGAHEVPL